MDQVAATMVVGLVSGGASFIGGLAALRVHVQYIREALERHEKRLIDLEKRVACER